MNTYTYELGKETYINLTNRCTNDCSFCIRQGATGLAGYDLWLEQEPTAEQVIEQLKEQKPDVVFCGFGEPTIKIEELVEIAAYVKRYGGHVRINTNGHANRFHGYNVVPKLKGVVDEVSISLNETDAKKYAAITKSIYGEQSYYDLLEFARECVKEGIAVTLSVVDVIGQKAVLQAQQIAGEIGATLRVREYISQEEQAQ